MRHLIVAFVALVLMASGVCGPILGGVASADYITPDDILGIPSGTTGSGNGTLDLRLMTFSGSEITNVSGGFNGDNGNNTLPNSGGADTSSFAESYVTTAGELQAFYNLNYGATTTGQIELTPFLDLNESQKDYQALNSLSTLDIILNPTTINGNPNAALDVTSVEQAAINQSYTGGTTIASLSSSPVNLPVNAQGAGWADYAFLTGIDPFTLNTSDVLLFNISMDTLSNGAEELFLSGTYSGQDAIGAQVPEPSTAMLLAVGAFVLTVHGCRRRRWG